MKRKKTDTVQLSKIRIREELRQKLAKDAERQVKSLNAVIVERLEWSFAEEEQWEAQQKEMEENKEAFSKMEHEWLVEQERERNLHAAALRDSRILNMMVEFKYAGALLLRLIAREIACNTDWVATAESKKAFADKISSIIIDRDFAGDFIHQSEVEDEK
jgi:hypothetical protein